MASVLATSDFPEHFPNFEIELLSEKKERRARFVKVIDNETKN